MAALGAAELTSQMQAMQADISQMQQTLNAIMPKIDEGIQTSQQIATDIDKKLAEHVNPIVEAKVIDTIVRLNDNHGALAAALDARVAELKAAITQVKEGATNEVANVKTRNDQAAAEAMIQSQKVDSLQQLISSINNDFETEKMQNQSRYRSTQDQIAVMHSQGSSSSTPSGKKSSEPIVCHKLFLNKTPLSGEEDYDAFDEWYIDMGDDFEILMPGSKRLLQEAENSRVAISMRHMLDHDQPTLLMNVSRELFSVLKKKTVGQARNQLKALSENEGLEAWRLIRANLCRKDGQRLQGEFDVLTALAPIKISNFRDFPTLHRRWESELIKFAAIDVEYKLGKFQKRNIIHRALPQEIKDDVDREQAHNQSLADYDKLVEFIINLSRSHKYQKTSIPKPLTTNLVDENKDDAAASEGSGPKKDETTYSVDEWIFFLKQDEGQQYLATGNALPQEGLLALNSIVKGGWNSPKGKGKGKDPRNSPKGKGKFGGKGKEGGKGKGGKAHIQCHGCGEYGHYVRDCPERGVKSIEDYDWGQYSPSRVALVVSDQPFTGYQVGKSNWFQSHFKPDTHVDTPDVPIPDVSWQRVVHTKNRSANSPGKTLKVKTKCNDSCGCPTENSWSNLIDGVDITATDNFLTSTKQKWLPTSHRSITCLRYIG